MASLNLDRIHELLGEGDRELIVALADIFKEETLPKIDHLGEKIRSGDAKSVRELAHAIKSSALNLGADALASIASQLEQSAARQDLGNAVALHTSIRSETASVLSELENLPELKAND